MKQYRVRLMDTAKVDMRGIGDYITLAESADRADQVLSGIARALSVLAELPEHGPRVRELVDVGTRDYREVFFGPYRIVYRVMDEEVVVHLIADGRRDMRTLLLHRLLDA